MTYSGISMVETRSCKIPETMEVGVSSTSSMGLISFNSSGGASMLKLRLLYVDNFVNYSSLLQWEFQALLEPVVSGERLTKQSHIIHNKCFHQIFWKNAKISMFHVVNSLLWNSAKHNKKYFNFLKAIMKYRLVLM